MFFAAGMKQELHKASYHFGIVFVFHQAIAGREVEDFECMAQPEGIFQGTAASEPAVFRCVVFDVVMHTAREATVVENWQGEEQLETFFFKGLAEVVQAEDVFDGLARLLSEHVDRSVGAMLADCLIVKGTCED